MNCVSLPTPPTRRPSHQVGSWQPSLIGQLRLPCSPQSARATVFPATVMDLHLLIVLPALRNPQKKVTSLYK